MNQTYWDKLAGKYENEIFSSLGSDLNGLITRTIKKYSSKKTIACDFGCGIGHYLPLLSTTCKEVHAYDLSPQLIEKARQKNEKLKNVIFGSQDLSKAAPEMPKIQLGICANVLITESYELRKKILDTISSCLAKNGILIIVVPSHESALYSNYRLFEWNLIDGYNQEEAIKEGLHPLHMKKGSVSDGLINIDNVTTKHYLKEELEVTLPKAGFKIVHLEKIEYGWDTEFDTPPDWMKSPYPWDWMVVAKKI